MTLKEWMDQEGLDQEGVASLVGFTQSTISRALNGATAPSWDLMKKLLEVTDGKVTPNDFVKQDAA